MRQLPAQFTDIFTSLQGGMPFFTVLVQQGGQIKTASGFGAGIEGVSSALLGMVNPYTVAAAAVGLVVTPGMTPSSRPGLHEGTCPVAQ